jgi:hypothetical protein
MPPTIILTVGRLAAELAGAELPPPADDGADAAVPLLPDEHAATVTAVAHAAARAASERLLIPILRIGATPLLRFAGKRKAINMKGEDGGTVSGRY